MNTQPEALRLATILQTSGWQPTQQELLEAAAELRRLYQSEREGWRYADELEQERKRLHEMNQALLKTLESYEAENEKLWGLVSGFINSAKAKEQV